MSEYDSWYLRAWNRILWYTYGQIHWRISCWRRKQLIHKRFQEFKKDMSQNKTVLTIRNMMRDDNVRIVEALDELKGSCAVKYVLEELLRKGNQHNLYSLLKLIDEGHGDQNRHTRKNSND